MPKRAGRVALRIKIDNQNALAFLGEGVTEIYGRGRLADAAFLVCDRDDFHERGTIMVRISNVRRPSDSGQSK